MAVGDAFGAPLRGRNFVAPQFPKLADGPFLQPAGGGPLELRRGQVAHVTQMACCLGWSLRQNQRYDAADAARRYRAWQPHALEVSEPIVKEVLEEMETSGLPVLTAGRRVWLRNGRQLAGNGSLMRTAPIGVFLARDAPARMQASFEDSALTHFDPRCQLACAALNAAIGHAITAGPALKPEHLLTAARTGLSVGAAALGRQAGDYVQEVTTAKAYLWEDLTLAEQADPQLYSLMVHMHRHTGLVRVAFRLAFWELLHAPSLEAALVDVVNRGGDTDANAAITGALLGAFHGEDALPAQWRKWVLEALSSVRGPLWDLYHPRQLLPLVRD
jgi:ADP-ribosylglycohydrolase